MNLSASSIVQDRSQGLIRDLWFFVIFVFFRCFFEKSLKINKICPKSDFFRPCEEAHRRIRIWCEYLKINWCLFDNIIIFRDNIWRIWKYYYFRWQYVNKCVFFSINPSLLSSQTTKIDFVCMYYDVWGTRSSNLIVPGADNWLKCQKN